LPHVRKYSINYERTNRKFRKKVSLTHLSMLHIDSEVTPQRSQSIRGTFCFREEDFPPDTFMMLSFS
jgi:hypothetical protein